MNFNDVRKNENKGFSLVELIVTIAIMAVMVTVLAPALLQYVEKSRMQKDDSAMGELTNVIQLALSDQDIYDEVLRYSCYGNVSCYIDDSTEGSDNYNGLTAAGEDYYIETKAATKTSGGKTNKDKKAQYMFTDETRQKDETEYFFAGNMRGVTITFQPDADGNFVLYDGVINWGLVDSAKTVTDRKADDVKYFQEATGASQSSTAFKTSTLGDHGCLGLMTLRELAGDAKENEHHYLYNRVRVNIGDSIAISSQTYRNSDYTVFIRMGSTGGNDASSADAVKVYGQWNGTNLEYSDKEYLGGAKAPTATP